MSVFPKFVFTTRLSDYAVYAHPYIFVSTRACPNRIAIALAIVHELGHWAVRMLRLPDSCDDAIDSFYEKRVTPFVD